MPHFVTLRSGAPDAGPVKYTLPDDNAHTLADVVTASSLVLYRTPNPAKTDLKEYAKLAIVTVETANLRYGWENTVSQTVGHPAYITDKIYLQSVEEIENFTFANMVAGENAVIQVSVEFP